MNLGKQTNNRSTEASKGPRTRRRTPDHRLAVSKNSGRMFDELLIDQE